MADLEVSARFILEGSKDLQNQLEQAGRAGGQVFGESLSGEAQKRLDGIVAQAEAAAKRVGLAFNKQKLRFEDASGQVVPDEVFNRLARLDKGLKDANRSLGQFGKEMQQAATGSIQALKTRLGELTTQLERVAVGSQSFRQLKREIAGVERDLRKAGEAGALASRGMGLLQGAMGLAGGFSAAQFLRSSIQQAIELENATRRLSNTLGPQGAGAALGFVRGISDQLGLSFRDLVGSYGRFTAAATAANVPLQQQQDLFTAVSRAGQSLGLTSDEVNGAFLALQQIASKGTVSMEELRQQLGERLPIALAATANGLGLSTQGLIKLVESGQLSANKFFPAFTKGLNELTSASGGMPTAAQNLQRFTNEWESLQVAFGENLLPGIVWGVKQLTEAIKELKTQGRGVELGFAFGPGGISAKAAQVVGELDRVQKKYNLTQQEALNIASQARAAAGAAKRGPTMPILDMLPIGKVSEEDRVIQGMIQSLDMLAKRYREGRVDKAAQIKADAAAQTALQGQLNEQIKAQQTLNSMASQREGLSALEQEADLIRQVAAGKMTQAQADKAMATDRLQTLQQEVAGYDALIAKLKEAKAAGAEQGNDKAILTAQSARAQKVLEIAKLEADASRAEVQRRQEVLQLAQTRLQIEQQRIGLEDQASQLAVGRLRAQQQVAEALLNLQQARQGLTESLFAVDTARQDFALRTAEQELQKLRDRGAGVDVIRQQEERIESLKRGAQNIEYRAMQAAIAAAEQRFELERRVLELKQAQQVLEARSAQRAAAQNTLQQRQRLLELQGQLVDPSISAGQRQALQQQVVLQGEAIRLAQQQQQAEAGRLQTLGVIFGLERQALAAQQQTTANGFRAQAATKGWEQSLSGPLDNLNEAAGSTQAVAAGIQQISAGFISAGGQTIQIKTTLDEAAGSTQAAADAAQGLANGYASANANAQALLGTLQRMAAVPQARWAGGDVEPGTRYRINELGRESFMDRAGNLSLISAPQNGFWTPPTAGTVIPAGITASLAAAGAFGGPSGRGGARATAFAPQRSAGVQGVGKLNAAINRLTARMDALVAKDWSVQVVTPSHAGILRSIGGL